MKQKILTLLLALLACAGITFAKTYSGTCGENLTWTLTTEDGVLTITGTGAMDDTAPWSSYRSSITSVTICNSVTTIGSSAFQNCISLTSVTIPNGVTSIGWYAFHGCSSLTSVTIPNSVTSIGSDAFRDCSSLTSIEIPNSVTSIGGETFSGCSSLTSITIPNSVTSIGGYAFSGCSSLTSIEIPNSVTSIGSRVFSGCSSLTSIEIPNSVTTIENDAFYGFSGLTSVVWNMKSCNDYSPLNTLFYYAWCAQGCYSVNDFDLRAQITSFTFGDNVEYIPGFLCSGMYNLTSVTIPNSVTTIGNSAFSSCSGMTSVTIGENVTTIGDYAFNKCSSLTSVIIPNSVTSIGSSAFSGCSSLTSIDIPNNVTTIGDYAFNKCSSLTSVIIPNSVTSIEGAAFRDCSSLTSVTIPNSVTSIEGAAFRDCSSLTTITCKAVTPPTVGSGVFDNVDKTIPLYVPAESVEDYSFYDGWKDFTNILPIEGTAQEMFTITFLNYDGTVLQSADVTIGTRPVYSYPTPTRPADAQYTYTFTGWTPKITTVTGDATYTAVYEETLNTYTITWQDEDGNVIKTDEVEYGTIPTFTGATPTKEATNEYSYRFAGWSPEIVAVTGDATYTAVFEETLNTYTVTWQDEDGNVIKTDEVAQGTTPAFTGTTPTKEGYTFAGWLPNIKPATDNAKYTTFFERNKIETPVYTVNINGENCSLNINNQYPEGTVITLEAVADECFEFRQWSDGNKDNPRTITVTANTNLTAEFNKVRYTVTGEPSTGGKVQIRKQ